MKVLVISAAFPPMKSGEATNAFHTCQQLAKRGIEVHVLTTAGNTAVVPSSMSVFPIMRTWSWAEVPRLRSFLRRCQPDAIYLMYLGWTYNFQFMSTFIPTIAKWVLPTVPFITRFENIAGAGPQTNGLVSRLVRKAIVFCSPGGSIDYQFGTLLRDSNRVVLLCGNHEATIEPVLPGVRHKCVLIPPPANMCMSPDEPETRERGRQALGAGPNDFLLAYIGFIYPGKGIETLLRAFKLVMARQSHVVRLAIIGGSLEREFDGHPNYLASLHALANELVISENVVWTGDYRWDDDEASAFLRAADACVLPFDNGVHLNNSSFASATAHALPIVTTRGAVLEPVFTHEQNVLLCRPKSADDLAASIMTLLDDATMRRQLSIGARQLSTDWYSWGGAIDKTVALFELNG